MVRLEDIITLDFPIKGSSLHKLIQKNADASAINGVSRIYTDREERLIKLKEDSLVGQIGNCLVSMFLTGDETNYIKCREKANANPYVGDNGQDIDGENIDIKTSKIRDQGRSLLAYHLIVRPAEKHDDTIYIHSLLNFEKRECYLTGWADTTMLPPLSSPRWIGQGEAHILPVPELNSMAAKDWSWLKGD